MKKTKYLILGLFTLGFVFFLSCTKNSNENHWEAKISNSDYTSVSSIFKNSDTVILNSIKSSNDESAASKYIISKANEIASYYFIKKNINLSKDFIDDPEGIVIFGLYMAARENYEFKKSKQLISNDVKKITTKLDDSGNDNDNMSCFMTAVGAVIGIRDARDLWKACIEGASERTLISAIKLLGKRVAGVITISFAIYEVGDCLDWW